MARKLTATQIEAYHRDGFLYIPGFFDPEELAPCLDALENDPSVGGHILTVHDGSEKTRGDH